ncbi:LytR/AlgR family response regulator transcription factor, partial [Clostridium neonatale]
MKVIDKFKIVIVEDETISNDELKYIVSKDERFNVVAQAYDGVNALKIIEDEEPEIVFIDINIPGKDGLELAEEIKKMLPDTILIFSTAYDKYAIKAFELKVYDYILKPYDENRIKDSLNCAASTLCDRINNNDINKIDIKNIKSIVNKIPCENNGRIILIDIDKIYFCYSEDEKNYVKTDKDTYYTSKTLYELLEKTQFFRCHRSYIVNLNRIKEVYSWFNGTYKLI